MIKEIVTLDEIKSSANVVRKSFLTVANEFGLTIQNCPTNAAFMEDTDLLKLKEKNVRMFGLFEEGKQVGFVVLEQSASTSGLFYLEKLAVLPDHRHKGYGQSLMDFAFQFVKEKKGERISIGIINENKKLKEWYINYGFTEHIIKKFPYLPFTVCLLEKDV